MLDFSDQTRTGISILTPVADEGADLFRRKKKLRLIIWKLADQHFNYDLGGKVRPSLCHGHCRLPPLAVGNCLPAFDADVLTNFINSAREILPILLPPILNRPVHNLRAWISYIDVSEPHKICRSTIFGDPKS